MKKHTTTIKNKYVGATCLCGSQKIKITLRASYTGTPTKGDAKIVGDVDAYYECLSCGRQWTDKR